MMVQLWRIDREGPAVRVVQLGPFPTPWHAIQHAAWDYPPGNYVAEEDGRHWPFEVVSFGVWEMDPADLEGLVSSVPDGLAFAERIAWELAQL